MTSPFNHLSSRLFLWFVLANLATAAAAWFVARPLLQSITAHDLKLQQLAEQAVQLYENQGQRALRHYLLQQGRQQSMHLILIAPDNQALVAPRGRQHPPRPAGGAEQAPLAHLLLGRQPLSVTINGRLGQYRLLAHLRPGSRWGIGFWLRTGSSVLILALLALLLSRNISRPLRQLSSITRRMAAGELDMRSPAALSQRRDELGELAREFDRMAAQLQRGQANQQQLLRDISHELRSPLTRLDVALELAREHAGDSPELQRIGLETGRINALIDEILTLIRLQSSTSLQCEELELRTLLNAALEDARYLAAGRIQFALHAAAEPLYLLGDERLLGRALDNVLRNACQYAPDGSVVDVSLSATDLQLCIAIADSGPGVDSAQLAQLFDPFYRTSEARERASGGHGVGLAIVAGVIRAHGGEIEARQSNSGGLCIKMCLPRAQSRMPD